EKLDKIIDRFIDYDSGRAVVPDPKRVKSDFDKLGREAIPALIRGINRAAAIDDSCPAVVIAKKLAGMLASSADPELLDFARENIGAGVTRSRHMSVLKDLRVMCILRKGELNRRGITKYVPPKQVDPAVKLTELASRV